jgi:glycerol-3-phosphate cytidylyltransferase
MKKKVLVDLSCTILHHGHVRLLKKASKLGKVVVALTVDKDIKKNKGYIPELKYNFRKEILLSLRYVNEVVPSKFRITNKFLKKNKVDILVRGSDYTNEKFDIKTIIYPRTKSISSSIIRKKSYKIFNESLK